MNHPSDIVVAAAAISLQLFVAWLSHVRFFASDASCQMSGVLVCMSAVRTVATAETDIMFYKFGMASTHLHISECNKIALDLRSQVNEQVIHTNIFLAASHPPLNHPWLLEGQFFQLKISELVTYSQEVWEKMCWSELKPIHKTHCTISSENIDHTKYIPIADGKRIH